MSTQELSALEMMKRLHKNDKHSGNSHSHSHHGGSHRGCSGQNSGHHSHYSHRHSYSHKNRASEIKEPSEYNVYKSSPVEDFHQYLQHGEIFAIEAIEEGMGGDVADCYLIKAPCENLARKIFSNTYDVANYDRLDIYQVASDELERRVYAEAECVNFANPYTAKPTPNHEREYGTTPSKSHMSDYV